MIGSVPMSAPASKSVAAPVQGEAAVPASAVAPLPQIDAFLAAVVAELDIPANLRDAIAYALLGGGKRLRPVLAWHCCAAAGGDPRRALAAGAAVELIHAFSLVHDDLPAMDDDDFRRGRPTLHKATSEAMAILAGDGMLTMAFGVLTRERDATLSPEITARLVAELVTGTQGMITGQVLDTLGGGSGGGSGGGGGVDGPEATSADDRLASLVRIHRNKTGALLRASCRMGAISAHASERVIGRVTDYADAVGLMFQVVDDLIDVTQEASHAGKQTGKDAAKGKLTYPGLIGIEASRREVDRLLAAALEAIAPLGQPAEPLAELARYMAVRTK